MIGDKDDAFFRATLTDQEYADLKLKAQPGIWTIVSILVAVVATVVIIL